MISHVAIIDDRDRIEVLEKALRRIIDWSEACPLERYPEPDYRQAEALLAAGGIALEVICACNMRHAVEGVGEIARAALKEAGTVAHRFCQ